MTQEERIKVAAFAGAWERMEGYPPAAFQKAIALQRFRRGQTTGEIIDALKAQRVDWPES